MKKKILLTLVLVSMLALMFAVASSAAILYKTADGTTLFTGVDENADRIFDSYEGSFPNTDESGNALTWYIVSTETTETDTVHTVASFLTLDTTGEHASLSDAGVYKYVNTEKELSLVSVYFPNNSGILTLNLSGDGYGNTYDFATDKSNLLYLTLPNTLTELPSRVCQSTPVIDCTIPDEAPFESISAVAFYKAKNLYSVDIPANVTIIYSNGHSNDGYPFYECVSLVDVDFAENSKLETIQQNSFNRCTALKEITIPNSVVNLGNNVFMYCSGLETVRLGANAGKGLTEYNVQSMLYGCNSLKYVYMSETMVPTTGSHLFASGSTGMVIFYTGNQTQYEELKAVLTTLTNNGKFINATAVEWDSTKDDQYYKDLAASEKKNYVVYGYNTCQAFYEGTHAAEAINGCQGVCTRCQETAILENPTHIDVWNFADENGEAVNVTAKIIATYKCEACGTINTTEEISAIFIPIGYTQPETGEPFLGYEVSINHKALERYEELSGETVQYGLLAGIASDVVGGKPLSLDEEGKLVANSSTAVVNFTGKNYTNFEIKITGINKTTSLYCNAYAVVGTNVSYICDTASETATKKDVVIVTE